MPDKTSSMDGIPPLERAKRADSAALAVMRHLRSLHDLRKQIVGHDLEEDPVMADIEEVRDFIGFVEAAMKDPRNMIEFISGMGRTYRGGF